METAKDKLVVIYFCSHATEDCATVTPLFHDLSQREEFVDAVEFVQIDNDGNDSSDAVAAKYQVTAWPTFLFVKNQTVQTEMVGANLAHATLQDWIQLFVMSNKNKS